MNKERKKRGSGLALLIGVAAGAAAGYWLNTTKGKLWRKKAMEQTEELKKDFGYKADEYSEMAREKAKEFSGSVKTYVDDILSSTSALEPEQTDEKSTSSPASAIKEGIEKAKQKLSNLNGEFGKA